MSRRGLTSAPMGLQEVENRIRYLVVLDIATTQERAGGVSEHKIDRSIEVAPRDNRR
jgi:hypothetical protein